MKTHHSKEAIFTRYLEVVYAEEKERNHCSGRQEDKKGEDI